MLHLMESKGTDNHTQDFFEDFLDHFKITCTYQVNCEQTLLNSGEAYKTTAFIQGIAVLIFVVSKFLQDRVPS